jgi:ABC-type phosphate transport system auxiliary subunit
MVLHSPWWIREHWGRAFEVLSLEEKGFATDTQPVVGHGIVVLRRRERKVNRAELERIDPAETREVEMLAHNLEQNRLEIDELRRSNGHYYAELARHERTLAELEERLSVIVNSRSWALTKPLRAAAARLRNLRGREDGEASSGPSA